ncbi:hypothetical protein, partial [Metallibacterium sp.]|uniref:hypothetical protein n=1 Tax=Metallibacterium sp. TaxID=2940281 RepID=UPI00261745E6
KVRKLGMAKVKTIATMISTTISSSRVNPRALRIAAPYRGRRPHAEIELGAAQKPMPIRSMAAFSRRMAGMHGLSGMAITL